MGLADWPGLLADLFPDRPSLVAAREVFLEFRSDLTKDSQWPPLCNPEGSILPAGEPAFGGNNVSGSSKSG